MIDIYIHVQCCHYHLLWQDGELLHCVAQCETKMMCGNMYNNHWILHLCLIASIYIYLLRSVETTSACSIWGGYRSKQSSSNYVPSVCHACMATLMRPNKAETAICGSTIC